MEMEEIGGWKPVFKTLKGFDGLSQGEWKKVVREGKKKGLAALPEKALEYVKFIEKETEVKVETVSVGPAREETIFAVK